MKKLFISCLVLFLALQLNAQTSADFSASYRCIESKNYYFTYLLQEKPEMKALLATSPILTEMAQTRQANLQKSRSAEECIAAFKLTDEEIQKAGEALSGLYQKGNALEQLMTQVIVPSGRYQQYKETGKELVQKIWEQDANGMIHFGNRLFAYTDPADNTLVCRAASPSSPYNLAYGTLSQPCVCAGTDRRAPRLLFISKINEVIPSQKSIYF